MSDPVKIGLVTLGCPKNEVDSEILVRIFEDEGAEIVSDMHEADMVFVNTCGFIQDAKEESIEMILQLAQLKEDGYISEIYVWGCLAERYKREIRHEFPEVDGFFGIEPFETIRKAIFPDTNRKHAGAFYPRTLLAPVHIAYLKISEGCDHPCTFCAIPGIKGAYRSRPLESVVAEARELAETGVKELVLIAQDTSQYGYDLAPKTSLVQLLSELVKIDKISWIRIMYMHPAHITDELLQLIATEDKICNYLDIPLQHISDSVLKAMKRKPLKQDIEALLTKIVNQIPDITLRTAFIVGFPGETEADFNELKAFVEWYEFDRVGVFEFSPEEGTGAAELPDQVPDEVKAERFDTLMQIQQMISYRNNTLQVSEILEVMIDNCSESKNRSFGRTQGDAYSVDQTVIVKGKYNAGTIYPVRITRASEYDLYGEVTDER